MRLLGPWEVDSDRGALRVPAGQLRTLLASLALSAGEPVGLDELAEQLWPEKVPNRARGILHTYAGRLRRLLGPGLVRTRSGSGYLLDVATETVDVHRFRALVRQAEHTDDQCVELARLQEALAMWRGRPFADLYSTWLDREVLPRLTEEWCAATGRRIELELVAGRPERLIPELRDLTTRYPTRESLWRQLITALHTAGRRAEALATYHQVRALLSDELGIDPGQQLVALHQAILLDRADEDPPPTPRPGRPPLHQLPSRPATFTGRATELAELDAIAARLGPAAPAVVSISGPPGVGKTALAAAWAHRVARRFPDTQLYLDLHGYGPDRPVPPRAAAAMLLRALGLGEGEIPTGSQERFALLRGALADRCPLLVLDNARDANQVRPLLPGAPALVVVTSRDQLRGLSVRDGAQRLALHRLSPGESVRLLARAIGPDRVADEPVAMAQLAELCDHLPLALAVTAERAHRVDELTDLVGALRECRLTAVSTGDGDPYTDLRTVLSWSYQTLHPDPAAMFRAVGGHPTGELDAPTAAELADMALPAARAALDQLVAANLVERHKHDRYLIPDLFRRYAAEISPPTRVASRSWT